MLCLSGFELYARWVPLFIINITNQRSMRIALLSVKYKET